MNSKNINPVSFLAARPSCHSPSQQPSSLRILRDLRAGLILALLYFWSFFPSFAFDQARYSTRSVGCGEAVHLLDRDGDLLACGEDAAVHAEASARADALSRDRESSAGRECGQFATHMGIHFFVEHAETFLHHIHDDGVVEFRGAPEEFLPCFAGRVVVVVFCLHNFSWGCAEAIHFASYTQSQPGQIVSANSSAANSVENCRGPSYFGPRITQYIPRLAKVIFSPCLPVFFVFMATIYQNA